MDFRLKVLNIRDGRCGTVKVINTKLHLVAKIVLTWKIEIPILNPIKSKFLSDQTKPMHEMT